jgi:serine/threonine protein kinase
MSTNTKMAMVRFTPASNDCVSLFGEKFIVQPHPVHPHIPYSSDAGKGTVYQLRDARGEYHALKIFHKKFRTARLLDSIKHLRQLENFPGLRAAKRQVVPPENSAAQHCHDLRYAMLMAWIQGKTWFDVLQAARHGANLNLYNATHLGARFLSIMERIEATGFAHTDISPGNVIVEPATTDVQLLDLEDLYVPGTPPPAQRNKGSTGYRHHSGDNGKSTWCAEGDRYATAVMVAEFLVLANPQLARLATDEGFFAGHCRDNNGMERYNISKDWLKHNAPEFATLFERAWFAETLAQCPRIGELHRAVSAAAAKLHRPAQTAINRAPTTTGNLQRLNGVWSNQPLVAATPQTVATTNKPNVPKPAASFWQNAPNLPAKVEPQQTGLSVSAKVAIGGGIGLLLLWIIVMMAHC